jgi:hypothetical protein
MKIFSDFRGIGYNVSMGILDNFENAWDPELQFESNPIPKTDSMGRDTSLVENDGLALKMFEDACCESCSCKN